MKKYITLAGLLALSLATTVAQTKREIKEEDPKLTANLRLELSPLISVGAFNNQLAGWGAKASYNYSNKFALSVEFDSDYGDLENSSINGDINEGTTPFLAKPVNSTNFDLQGTYYFAVKERDRDEYVGLKARRVGYNTVELTVDKMPVTRLALYGIRAGYQVFKGSTVETEYNLAPVTNPSAITSDMQRCAVVTTNMFHAGITASRIKNLKVLYPGLGTRRKQYIREYYLEGLYAASQTFANLPGVYNGKATDYTVTPLSSLGKTGWRLGFNAIPTGRIVNVGYGIEIGSYPTTGAPNGRFGLNFHVMLALETKAGLSKE